MIEVVTAEGVSTGVVKPKPDVHRDGDWHRAVHVWILTPDGRLVVQQRALTKENNPGLWDVSCAGHISAGEDVVAAAIREAREELGVDLAPDELRYVATIPAQCVLNGGTYIDNELHEIFFVCRDVDPRELRLQEEEVDDARIVSVGEFRAMERVAHGEEYELIESIISGGPELEAVFIAAKTREIEFVQQLLDDEGIAYWMRRETFVRSGPFAAGSYHGVLFEVLAGQADYCRRLIAGKSLAHGVVPREQE